MDVRLGQLACPEQIGPSMLVSFGILTDTRLVHESNTERPILVTSGMLISVRLVQDLKASSPITVTVLGRVTEVTVPQPERAEALISVTP